LHPLREKIWLSGDLEDFSEYWVNSCAARYYEVDYIRVK
jgi:hypothetical protein